MALDLVPTDYGDAAMEALAAAVARAKGDDPLRPVTVVVPSNYAGVAARRALARRSGTAGRSGVAGLTVVTLYRLAELLAGPTLARSGRVPVSSPVVSTAVRAALADEPGLFRPVADQPSTVEALRRAHRELRDLGEEDRRRLAEDARAAAVLAIDHAVTERLRPHWYDETDLMAAAATVAAGGLAAVDLGPLIVHLPQDLTSHGAVLLRALGDHSPVMVLLGTTGRADAPAARIAQRLGRPWTESAPERPDGHAAQVELVVAADEDDEVRAALRRVLRAAESGLPLERVAIVHAPGAVYGRLLAEHLGAARIPWNGVTDLPLAERVAGRTLLALLDAELPALRRRDVFALLASAPVTAGRPVATWERLARDAGVVAGRDQWEQRLGTLALRRREQAAAGVPGAGAGAPAGGTPDEPGGRAIVPTWPLDQAERAEALRSFVSSLADLSDAPAQRTWSVYASWARTLLTHVLGTPSRRAGWPADETRAAEEVERVLDRLSRLDAVVGDDSRPRRARSLVDRAIFRAAVDAELSDGLRTVGRLGEGLFVGPIPLAIGIDIDLVVVLGLVEGGLPGPLSDDPLLAEASRHRAGGALRTAADRRALLHHQLLAVAGAATTTVVASRPTAELRTGRSRSPSRWLADLQDRSPSGPTVRHASFLDGLRPRSGDSTPDNGAPDDGAPANATGPPASEQEAAVTELASLWVGGHPLEQHPLAQGDDVLRRALSLVRARSSDHFTRYDGNLAELAAQGVDLSPRQPTNPTALEAWARCPYAYFVRHVLGVREPDRPDDVLTLRPTDRGTLVHSVLESALGGAIVRGEVPGPGEPWSEAVLSQLLAELDAHARAAELRGIVGAAVHWRQEQRRLRRRLDGFLALDRQARAALAVIPVAAELSFGREAPVQITLPGGHVLTLTGQVDRVDAGDGRVVVVDYKTGSPPREKQAEGDPLAGGRLLQLPIYALAASQQLGRPGAEVVAEYWYLDHREANRKRHALTVDALVLERLGDVLAAITGAISAGLFVPHPDPPDPWGWSRCPYCDPDGADTATLWSQWQRKQGDPAVAPYLELVS